MKFVRRSTLIVMLAISFLPRPSFADMTIVAQGTGSVTSQGLKCSFPIVMTFEVSGSDLVLHEADGPGTPVNNNLNESKAYCASTIAQEDIATNVVPKEAVCQPTPLGTLDVGVWTPYTFTGTGTTTSPYTVKMVSTTCDGKSSATDRMVFYKANVGQNFLYTHDILDGTTVTNHVTATLTRMQ